MPTSADVVYVDSSALVKMLIQEKESGALRQFLSRHPLRASSNLAITEVMRTARRYSPEVVAQARDILNSTRLLLIDETLLERAAQMQPITLRTLDAIHLAAAQTVASELYCLVTYDKRMAEGAAQLGFRVEAPATTG